MADDTSNWGALVKPWIELNQICWNFAYEQTLGRVAHLPPVGLNRGLTLKVMQAIDAWARIYPTTVAYQLVLTEIHLQALEKLAQMLVLQMQEGKPVSDWAEVLQLWSSTADRIFETAFCQEDNLKIRGEFLNAVNYHKRCQQALLETWLNQMNLPTRSELDEVHKSIYELRKEVKRLRSVLIMHEAKIPANSSPH